MMRLPSARLPRSRAAFSLIEVTLALGIAAFCLITVFALLPIGLNSAQNASEQTVVAGIATAISADLHGVTTLSGTGQNTSQFQFLVPASNNVSAQPQVLFFASDGSPSRVDKGTVGIPTGNGQADVAKPNSRYRVTVGIYPDPILQIVARASKGYTPLYKVWILITWPALADPNTGGVNTPPTNFSGSFETSTALNYYTN